MNNIPTELAHSQNSAVWQNQESKEKDTWRNFFKDLLKCWSVISTDARSFFWEENYMKDNLDNFCSFIWDNELHCRDFLIVYNWVIYFIPYQSNLFNRDEFRNNQSELSKLFKEHLSQKEWEWKPNRMKNWDWVLWKIIDDWDNKFPMKSVFNHHDKIYWFIKWNKQKTLADYKRIWELLRIKDYPLPSWTYFEVNGEKVFHPYKENEAHFYKWVCDVLWMPSIDLENIWKFYSNNSVLCFVNSTWNTYITQNTQEARELLERFWYKERAMQVPYSNQDGWNFQLVSGLKNNPVTKERKEEFLNWLEKEQI